MRPSTRIAALGLREVDLEVEVLGLDPDRAREEHPVDAQVAAEAVEVLARRALPAAHDLHVHRDAREHAPRHVEELRHPALEDEALERAAQRRVRPGAEHDAFRPHGVGGGDDGEDRGPLARRPLADAPDDLLDRHVGQARPEHDQGRLLAGHRVEQLPRGERLRHEPGLALQEAHLEPQLARVEARDEDAPRHGRQLTTRCRLRRKRKARWKTSGRIVLRPRNERTRS